MYKYIVNMTDIEINNTIKNIRVKHQMNLQCSLLSLSIKTHRFSSKGKQENSEI